MEGQRPGHRLIAVDALEVLGDAYASVDSGYRRTANTTKTGYDHSILLLGIIDELRLLRAAVEAQGKMGRPNDR